MRFRFLQTGQNRDEAARQAVLNLMDSWWSAFGAKREELLAYFKNERPLDVAAWMQKHLQRIDERLMWEFGPGLKGGHRLVVTPEVHRELRPMVDTLIGRCPGYEGWEFYSSRPRESVELARSILEARGLAQVDKTLVAVTPNEACRIDLAFYSKRHRGPEDHDALASAWVASEVILGEATLDVWIGDISVHKGKGKREGAVPLGEMQAAVDEAVARIQAGLPAEPFSASSVERMPWGLFELQPRVRDEYPRRLDLRVAPSCHKVMLRAAQDGTVFDSRRYSRFGELFVYVKTDGTVDLSGEKYADRGEMQDAITEALEPRGLGAVVGGGTGLKYSYIDLALADPDAGISAVVEAMRAGNMVKETWIQFFDARYANEWVGIWDDSPLPPGMEA